MKLGIAVVYLVKDENEKLLDLHLHKIEKHTQVPYTIYASTNQLLPKFEEKLKQQKKIQICRCQTFDPSASPDSPFPKHAREHSFYLEQLIQQAIEDNMTHIAILHVDSFPVRSGWAEELAEKLSEPCVLASVKRVENRDYKPCTQCLFFHRDFYLKHHPTLLLSKTELSSPEYRAYQQQFKHHMDSGVGYGFKVYREGLSWYPLLRSNRGEDHYTLGSIYGNLIFHLGASARDELIFVRDSYHLRRSRTKRVLTALWKLGSLWLPANVKQKFDARFKKMWRIHTSRRIQKRNESAQERVKKRLFRDPERYLDYLRTGLDRQR